MNDDSGISGGGSAEGPAVDVSRPASELSDELLCIALAPWMGWRWQRASGRWLLTRPTGLGIGAVWRDGDPAPKGNGEWAPNWLTHDGAAAIRAHVRSLGPEAVALYVRTLFEAVGVDEPTVEAAEFAVLDAEPRQQAEAAYEAFIRQPIT